MKWQYTSMLFLLLAAAVSAGCGRGEVAADQHAIAADKPTVEVAEATCCGIKSSVDLSGTLLPVRSTTVVSDVDGIIESFPNSKQLVHYEENGEMKSVALVVGMGHEVKADDVLVQIDPTDFRLALGIAKANLELAKRNLDELKAWRRQEEVDRLEAACRAAKAEHDGAKADLKREEELLKKDATSDSTYDNAVKECQTAAANVAQAEAAKRLYLAGPTAEKFAVAQARVAAAQAEVDLRQEKLNKTTIKAKYDSVIVDRYVDVGDRVTALPRVEIIRVVDPRLLFAQVSVPERYQQEIKLDDVAVITGDGISGRLPGQVAQVNSMVDPETRTFRVRVAIDNRERKLKPGGFVNVELPLASESGVVVVPHSAVTFTDGRPAVFVYADGTVRKTPVKIGISDEDGYEVCEGLSEGESVVVGRTSLLADGMAVEATPWKPKKVETTPAGKTTVKTAEKTAKTEEVKQ